MQVCSRCSRGNPADGRFCNGWGAPRAAVLLAAGEELLHTFPHYANRLEGQAALAAPRPATRRQGFAALGAIWEAALSSLLQGEALAAAGRSTDAEPVLHHAAAVFARVGASRERETAEALIGSLR